jgi:hypothetical protein
METILVSKVSFVAAYFYKNAILLQKSTHSIVPIWKV